MKDFYYEIELRENDIKINCHKRLYTSEDFSDRFILFDKRSLPKLIKVLEQGDCINLLKEPTIKTDWDEINFWILGDERSSEGFCLELFNDREFLSGDEDDCFGPITIPLGRHPEQTGWEYVRPLIEDLKKYC